MVVRYGRVEHPPDYEDTFSKVLLTIIHPLYSYKFEELHITPNKNDMALLKTTPMKVKRFCKLSSVDFFSLYGYEAVLAGYGITTTKLPDGTILTNSSLNLLKPLQILKVLMYKCGQNFLRPGFCLAPKCGRKMTSCPGDSGSPLIHPSGVVGVLSLAELTTDCLYPTINSRVSLVGVVLPISPYIEWILSHVTA
ncbi:hypothetical protein RR46_01728 [Papilio xuthus]|nr:hypothetical protein RR46_01728 [Papilio xuthus]